MTQAKPRDREFSTSMKPTIKPTKETMTRNRPPRDEAGAAGGSVSATGLRCEYLSDPLGIDVLRPRLGWRVVGTEAGEEQTAYRILAASSAGALAEGADLWDSGRVESDRSAHLVYGGKPPGSGERVYWCVRLWDRRGRPGSLSATAWWEAGLLDPSDWQASWIAGPEPAPLLRKTFTVARPVASARLYLCGQGACEARVNGLAAGDRVLGPQLSFFPARMLYDTFDVTAHLQPGRNALAVQLVPGWYGGERNKEEFRLMPEPEGTRHALIARLEIRYADGGREAVVSDATWKAASGGFEPVATHWVHCFQGSGERHDAGRDPAGWDGPAFDDRSWPDAQVIAAPTRQLSANMIEPNRVVETVRPVSVSDVRESPDRDSFAAMAEAAGAKNWSLETMTNPTFARHWQPHFTRCYEGHDGQAVAAMEVDFGKHISGWVRADVTGEAGDTVTMFGLDQHRLGGRGTESAGQRFAHRAFRYVPIHFSGAKGRPQIGNIRALDIRNDVRRTGRFECSHPVLNRIHDAAARTWAALLLGGMPHDSWRERFGTALIENFESSFYWCDMGAFYTKWLTDHRDMQRADGYPFMSGAPIAYDYWSPATSKNSTVLVPWLMYLHYGDRDAVEKNYPAMRRWLAWCEPKSDEGRTWQPPADHGEAEAGYGDHGRPTERWYDPHTGDLFETLHTIHCFRLAGQMASLLGRTDDARHYGDVRRRLVAKVNRAEFFADALYGGGDQGCQAIAVHENTAPEERREAVARHLIRDVTQQHGNHLNTGFIGTWYLLKALTMLDQPDTAVRLVANETPPSFACMLRHPDSPEELTFLPEFHGRGMIPHPGWCSVGVWFYEALAGLAPAWEQPGFRHFAIRPQVTRELDWVKAEHDSIAGTIGVAWAWHGREIELAVEVPSGSRAQIHVPAGSPDAVKAPASARLAGMDGRRAVFEAAGGRHVFRSVPARDLGDARG